MIKTPFHKQTDPAKQAGQVKNEITLGNYLENKYPEEMKKKMTFEEWYKKRYNDIEWMSKDLAIAHYTSMKKCWEAAQENK